MGLKNEKEQGFQVSNYHKYLSGNYKPNYNYYIETDRRRLNPHPHVALVLLVLVPGNGQLVAFLLVPRGLIHKISLR